MQQASPRRLVAANLLLALAYAAAAPLVFAFGLPPAYVSPVYHYAATLSWGNCLSCDEARGGGRDGGITGPGLGS